MLLRFVRFAVASCVVAVLTAIGPGLRQVLRADSSRGLCRTGAHADASSYDGSQSGSADADVTADDYELQNCVALGQTNAIFTAGAACQNAGIPPGVDHGIGYAIVTWYAVWQISSSGEVTVVGPIQQQYDCGDTFS
jgi:hypothetical protein